MIVTEDRVAPSVESLPAPYLLFLGDTTDAAYAKTAFGLRDWAGDRCIGEYACARGGVTTGLPWLTPGQAYEKGARSLVIGIANEGGVIEGSWIPALVEALTAGLDLVSGMHARLESMPVLRESARKHGRRLIDVRRPPEDVPIATGRKRTGKRLLTVGTDCAIGKKYTALALTRGIGSRGAEVDFRATGQTGILIAGSGIPIDAVVADFMAGAAEMLTPDADPEHWDVIEGQGSLCHPAYSGVSLALLHGSQPDVFVVCHDPTREHLVGLPGVRLLSVAETIDLTLRLGARTNPRIRCGGVSLNSSQLDEEQAKRLMAEQAERLNLPVADPMRGGAGFDRLVDACLG
jgi:uncharacterized NAD-dependent epimerase/dehydratase family protein